MHTFNEITSQATQLERTYEVVSGQTFIDKKVDMYLFVGCGTSFYLAAAAARYFQTVTGHLAQALPASEIFLNPESAISENKSYHIITISRSGTTSEIIAALELLQKRKNISTMAVTCHGNSPMAKLADESVALDHINEKSVVMTQSFTNMLYALQLYAAKQASSQKDLAELRHVPKEAEKLLEHANQTKEIASSSAYQRFVFLGMGMFNGIAKEATLKLKEMTQTECESYSSLEFRHGPISIVDQTTVVVMVTQAKTEKFDQDLVNDIQKLGGKVLTIGPVSEAFSSDEHIQLNEAISDRNTLVLTVPHLQLLAYHRAISLGLNPDQPRNLTQVVTLKL